MAKNTSIKNDDLNQEKPSLKFPKLRKELAIILTIKVIILIAIKMLFFSNPLTDVEQAITHQFLSHPSSTQESTRYAK